ncbi:hypothetical protein B9T62_22810 [Paenibacillus donghaensis]|uniref:Uncharacterized protein n=1 Tax=Paenibacillus donghaensis TaxID=414771 RepID=A0A2Z2KCN9_9BACL|nr:hypothetical protein B9T62_22810 [Paenibacillus donghaensis]
MSDIKQVIQHRTPQLKIANGNALFTLVHITTYLIPKGERSQHGGSWFLRIDQQTIIKGVFIDSSSEFQIIHPIFR